MSNVRRSMRFIFVVLLSFALPIGVVAWSLLKFASNSIPQLGSATIKNDEMWYLDFRTAGGIFWDAPFEAVIKCRNLRTGGEKSTTMGFLDPMTVPVYVGDSIYLVTSSAVYLYLDNPGDTSGTFKLRFVADLPDNRRTSVGQSVFAYQGELTTVIERTEGECRLAHLREQQWVDGRKIRRPPDHCAWYDNPDDGRLMIQPTESPQTVTSATATRMAISTSMGISFVDSVSPSLEVPPATGGGEIIASSVVSPISTEELDLEAVAADASGSHASSSAPPIETTSSSVAVTDSSANPVVPSSSINVASPELPSSGANVPALSTPPLRLVQSPTLVRLPTLVRFASPMNPPSYALSIPSPTSSLYVQQFSDQVHLIYRSADGFCAYRNGFEFDDATTEAVSALETENGIRDANGWEQIRSANQVFNVGQMVCDRDGALFNGEFETVIRRNLRGEWVFVKNIPGCDLFSSSELIVDPDKGIAYVIGESGKLLRIDGDSVQSTDFHAPDRQGEYLLRWAWFMGGLAAAWGLHYLIVACGAGLLTRPTCYDFGIHRVTLASTWHRGLAFAVDATILGAVLLLSIWAHLYFLAPINSNSDQPQFIDLLKLLESVLTHLDWEDFLEVGWVMLEFLTQIFVVQQDPLLPQSGIVVTIALIDTGFVLWLLKVYLEGRCGKTPGKWLFGIQSMRTTLRPLGCARALVRGALNWVDLCALITPLPAAASLIYSTNRQRWGDRVADTIVINAHSMRKISDSRSASES